MRHHLALELNTPYQPSSAQGCTKPLDLGRHIAYFMLHAELRFLSDIFWWGNHPPMFADIYCMLEELVAGITSLYHQVVV